MRIRKKAGDKALRTIEKTCLYCHGRRVDPKDLNRSEITRINKMVKSNKINEIRGQVRGCKHKDCPFFVYRFGE